MSAEATITIGNVAKPLSEATASWIQEQFGSRGNTAGSVCVRVSIHAGDVNLAFATSACGNGGGGATRTFNSVELRIIELWRQHKLDTATFSAGQLVAFVQQLRRLL